ncbi:hypothetical protein AMS68_007073 [Peltaster fructicola]|uniref:Trafficking protein particle complex subunit 11 domain-containing protein n=1 Tax=Peltaster fructicola TaxID=286661 RepID=A0A6H0Y3M7_9PEZI|nr:hypothetical protein AMS68_007073 [Peltaster fructicola]
MEELPAEYTEHNLPYVLLSGLIDEDSQQQQAGSRQRQDSGTRIFADSPLCGEQRARSVLAQLLKWDGRHQPWNAISLPGPTGTLKYRLRSLGRSYTLPPRKAAPLPQSPTTEAPPGRQISHELHSPLSPLSPGSPIFPDGIMTPLWFSKHQYQVPCLIVAFFDFTYAGRADEDDKIKADINAIKLSLSRSGFRTRFAAVLMSEKSIIQSTEMEERFASIRRATSSDAKTGLFFMPPMPSDGEIASFVLGMLTTLQPLCVEYYRELTKHARRKKSRNSVPAGPLPMHGAAQSLSTPGWNARYEIKQAIFAEYRQEMNVAERHYTQVIEDLCDDGGFLESTPNWSPRWDEARLLCDTVALRVIRCHLWNGMTTTAAQFWFEYRSRFKNLIDRKGKGSHTYGWLAWETRWASIMAQLIDLAELPMLETVPRPRNEAPIDLSEFHAYARKDRAFESYENLPPIFLLHHAGYWSRLALTAARARHRSALDIPDDDRVPPGQSPASSVANRVQAYDTYLVPEPHEEWANAQKLGLVDHVQIGQITEQAGAAFTTKNQLRMKEQLDLELAADLMADKLYVRAMDVLAPHWDASIWRDERWHNLFEKLLNMLNRCSIVVKNAEIALATAWEQLCLSDADDSITRTLKELALPSDVKIAVDYQNSDRLSPVDVRFAFDEGDAHAGGLIRCQLILQSRARAGTHPLSISSIEVSFAGQQTIHIRASDDVYEGDHIHELTLLDSAGTAALDISPGQLVVLNFTQTFTEAGPVYVQHICMRFQHPYVVTHTIDDATLLHAQAAYTTHAGSIAAYDTRRENTTHLVVQPKPPKVDITFLNQHKQYYVGEALRLDVRLTNGEAQGVSGSVTSKVTQVDDYDVPSKLSGAPGSEETITGLQPSAEHALVLAVDSVQLATQLTVTLTFSYTLDEATQNVLVQTLETTIPLMPLFEPKWTFGPLLHADIWPTYFDPDKQESLEHPAGIPQRWKAAFSAKSLASNPIIVHRVAMHLKKESQDTAVNIRPSAEHPREDLVPDKLLTRGFELTTTKVSADDRRPFQFEPTCQVDWSHEHDETIHTSQMSVPRLTMPSSEPRVLCTVDQPKGLSTPAEVQYYLENLSTHFLTFALTMQASEDFAFMGAKYRTLSLAPLSRLCVPYKIVPHVVAEAKAEGCWVWPNLQVVDSYYQKTLRIQPAGDNVKLDAQNGLGVFIRQHD